MISSASLDTTEVLGQQDSERGGYSCGLSSGSASVRTVGIAVVYCALLLAQSTRRCMALQPQPANSQTKFLLPGPAWLKLLPSTNMSWGWLLLPFECLSKIR